jgi:hypothetical protein
MLANNQNEKINPDESNQDAYDDLVVSIEAGEGKLNLLICVCERIDFCHRLKIHESGSCFMQHPINTTG